MHRGSLIVFRFLMYLLNEGRAIMRIKSIPAFDRKTIKGPPYFILLNGFSSGSVEESDPVLPAATISAGRSNPRYKAVYTVIHTDIPL